MAIIQLKTNHITDWVTFHEQSKIAFGFPAFYGANMDAFIDCLTYIDEGDGMSSVILKAEEKLIIKIIGTTSFRNRLPDVAFALSDSVDAINERFAKVGKEPRVQIVWED